MTTTITQGDVTLTPDSVTGIRSQRESRNVVHAIIGREDDSVTLRPAGLRSGTIEIVYYSGDSAEAQSAEAELLHAAGGVFSITSEDRPSLSFSYITDQGGRIARELYAETGMWTVTVDYREVQP